jgi:hypothetical protein
MNEITRIRPLTDEQAAHLVSTSTLLELQESILDVPRSHRDREMRRSGESTAVDIPRRLKDRRRLRIAAVGALVVAVVAFIALAAPGGRIGSVHVGAQPAQALSFTRRGGEISIIVRNPLASPATFRHELTDHHLHINLQLVTGSPSTVGTLAYIGQNSGSGAVHVIQAKGRCRISATRDYCPVGVRVPAGYNGSVSLGFVVPTPAGMPYETSGSATAPGEAMHGLHYVGLTVSQVLAMLARRDVQVQSYRHTTHHGRTAYTHLLHAAQVPHTWLVFQATPYAPHEVILWVGASAAAQGFKSTPEKDISSAALLMLLRRGAHRRPPHLKRDTTVAKPTISPRLTRTRPTLTSLRGGSRPASRV